MMDADQTEWVGVAVQVCKAAALQGVSVTITREIEPHGDRIKFVVGEWNQTLSEADYRTKNPMAGEVAK